MRRALHPSPFSAGGRYVVLELVDARDKRLKGAKKKKTKVVKKTLQPVWNEEVVWEDLKDDPADVFLKVSAPLSRLFF